jgi:hypothetical protein
MLLAQHRPNLRFASPSRPRVRAARRCAGTESPQRPVTCEVTGSRRALARGGDNPCLWSAGPRTRRSCADLGWLNSAPSGARTHPRLRGILLSMSPADIRWARPDCYWLQPAHQGNRDGVGAPPQATADDHARQLPAQAHVSQDTDRGRHRLRRTAFAPSGHSATVDGCSMPFHRAVRAEGWPPVTSASEKVTRVRGRRRRALQPASRFVSIDRMRRPRAN